MTAPGSPGNVADLSDAQRALLDLTRLPIGLGPVELRTLLAVITPDVPSPERWTRYRAVNAASERYDALLCGQLTAADFLGAQDPDDDSDEDERLHAARIVAWFEVTSALHTAAPGVTVDEHAAQMIDALCEPEQPAQVAA